jgi:hypothetical protein
VTLDQDLKHQWTLQLHLEVVDHVIVKLDGASLDKDGALQDRTDVKRNHKVVSNTQIDLLLLDLELTSHGSLLGIVLDDFRDSGKNYE